LNNFHYEFFPIQPIYFHIQKNKDMESATKLIAGLESDLKSLDNGSISFVQQDTGKENHITSILGRIADIECLLSRLCRERGDTGGANQEPLFGHLLSDVGIL
jgi:hypothetical protein